ncbi:MAG: hypothetical protein JJLCMIEE_00941 [Acidimicrobiales bacterium]|nr:hypothetical protein [Acidimicrobiales bacterium]
MTASKELTTGMAGIYGWRPGEPVGRADGTPMYEDARMMMFTYTADPTGVASILPEPLEPVDAPMVTISVCDYPVWWGKDGVNRPYNEVIFFVQCECEGEVGFTIPYIYIGTRTGDFTDGCDAALCMGREFAGFPKKLANISINRDGDEWSATMDRRRVRLLDFRARFEAPLPADALPAASMGRLLLVKEILGTDWLTYDTRKVVGVGADWLQSPKSVMAGSATAHLGHLDEDPLDLLAPREPIMAVDIITDMAGDIDAPEVIVDLRETAAI